MDRYFGKLYYDTETQRIDIKFEDGSYYGGLHCGDTFYFLKDNSWINPEWIPTRIESDIDGEWYLVGVCTGGEIPINNTVRLKTLSESW